MQATRTPEEREEHRAKQREQARKRRASGKPRKLQSTRTPEEREEHRAKQNKQQRKMRASPPWVDQLVNDHTDAHCVSLFRIKNKDLPRLANWSNTEGRGPAG